MGDAKVEGRLAPAPVLGVPVTSGTGEAVPEQNPDGVRSKVTALWGRTKDVCSHVVSQMKPWSEVLDTTSFSKPAGLNDALSRIRKNVRYFKFNYLTITFLVTAVTFLLDPPSLGILFTLGLVWFYLLIVRREPLTIGGRTLSQREQLLGTLGITLLIIFFLTNVGGELIYALLFSAAVISGHGAFRVPDELFLDDDVESSTLVPNSGTASLQSAIQQVTG
uniref:PRA1 family protein n=1 Tax=Tetraselmis sp. GSL018 TaxID=582737 RepID=A0A061SJ67_9CHLO|mmetsp:Transcript_19836/g.47318  ORF Transcript_19836/g.47318 Transcript_19836/m.47318 type:complete len:221 (-) Transcript_19836:150-812(-)|eukprot:CAMPEP_0177586280 /NCGR_PEP_ID=MMETSP0419_2-20121207/4982_1 /TAXON_ID=582737 /ORGANISM="Tetraselmis sp., Strain GSL018" /LENGTH=220 /DNA_ID=CAMNT_0019076149 /DNA_START=258 /DNA_END=920 /DNA_ORIENTATION=-